MRPAGRPGRVRPAWSTPGAKSAASNVPFFTSAVVTELFFTSTLWIELFVRSTLATLLFLIWAPVIRPLATAVPLSARTRARVATIIAGLGMRTFMVCSLRVVDEIRMSRKPVGERFLTPGFVKSLQGDPRDVVSRLPLPGRDESRPLHPKGPSE